VFCASLLLACGQAGAANVKVSSFSTILTEVAGQAMVLYRDFIPVNAGVFADPELLERLRRLLRERGDGPQRAYEPIVAYLEAEQALGRVAAGVDLLATDDLGVAQRWTGPDPSVKAAPGSRGPVTVAGGGRDRLTTGLQTACTGIMALRRARRPSCAGAPR